LRIKAAAHRALIVTIALMCLMVVSTSGQRGTYISLAGVKLVLALDRLQAARWYPPSTPGLREEADQDNALVTRALVSTNVELRRLAVRGVGRREWPADVPVLATFLGDSDAGVRREAAHAIAQAVIHSKDDAVMPAYAALTAPQPRLRNAEARAAVEEARLDAIARLHYSEAMARRVIQTFLPSQTRQILTMLRQRPNLELPIQLQPLLDKVRVVDALNVPSEAEFEILRLTGHLRPSLIVGASTYHCPNDVMPFPCSALRELAVQSLIADHPAMANALKEALKDPWPDVRVHALRRVGEAVKRTHNCGPLIDTLRDSDELGMVKIEALALLEPRCNEIKDAIALARQYSVVSESTPAPSIQGWPIRARAIEILAELDPAEALDALEHASRDVAQVRAARARAATTLRAVARLREYAEDDEPTVRTAALRGLSSLADPSRIELAIRNLDSADYELIATSAEVLEHAEAPVESAMFGLWFTFKRLTQAARETARFPRLAILACLEKWAPPVENVTPVRPYVEELRIVLRDADPIVAEAASRVIGRVTGVRPTATPTYRSAAQPDESEILAAPARGEIQLDGGETIEFNYLRDDAPLAVTRFAKLAKHDYFKGQAFFYRVTPFIALNGGSPEGHDLSGDARFWRDEIGLERHMAGVIGLLTHGRDTADGRFFIDLTDQPAFDHEYTLFARITRVRLIEPWGYLQPDPPPSALVRGGTILAIR
jgi:cyclophilin family peptidyl-prolyl cis-trans isomerase/HEAT repeat protein